MLITYPIQMDLRNRSMTPVVYAVQNEGVSRAIELVLKDGGESWSVPTGTTAAIRFRKSDGKGGIYDTLPDDSPAYNIDGNKVTFYLAPQVLTSDGIATVQLVLMQGGDVLCSFGVHINVETDVSLGEQGSEDYVNLTNLMMEQIENYFATHPDAGLSVLLLPNIDGEGVSSHNVYISDFQIPTGFVPKSGDLVLHCDGYLGYIQSVDHEIENTVNVVMLSPPVSLKGKQGEKGEQGERGYDARMSIRFGVSPYQYYTPADFYDYVPNMTEDYPYLFAEFTVGSGLDLEKYTGLIGVYGVGEDRVKALIEENAPKGITEEEVNELIDGKKELFVAHVNTTTLDEIMAAYNAGKMCVAVEYERGGCYQLAQAATEYWPYECWFIGLQESGDVIDVVRVLKHRDTGITEWDHIPYPMYTMDTLERLVTIFIDERPSDWNANEGEAGYIKNRPFYDEIGEGTVTHKLDAKYLPMDDIVNAVQASGGGSGGLSKAQINALDGMFKIVAFSADPTAAYTAFKTAFGITDSGEEEPDEPGAPEVTLSSISATYTGGDVAVGTNVTDLTGIVVTAHYSDGSTETVTDYTLSGTIAEGSNTITVSYGGKTTTITVTGVVEEEPLYGRFWPPKGKVLDWNVPQWDDVENFAYTGNTGSEYVNAGLPGGAFVRLDKLQGTVYIRVLTNDQYGIMAQGVYQVYANSDGEIATGGFAKIDPTIYRQFGGKMQSMDVDGTTYYFMMFKFEIPAGQTGYFISTPTAMAKGYFISTDKTGIDDAYKPYYTLFGSDPSDRITEPATEVA